MTSRGYLALSIAAAVVAIGHTATFVALHGVDLDAFLSPLLDVAIHQVIAVDLLLLTIAFFAWSWRDARANDVRGWPIVALATIFIAVSCGVPLYLFLRERQREAIVAR